MYLEQVMLEMAKALSTEPSRSVVCISLSISNTPVSAMEVDECLLEEEKQG